MSKLLGANWVTTVWGWVTLLCAAIAFKPSLIAFLPDSIEGWVSGIAGLIAFITGGAFAYQVKSKNVTGGIVQQTAEGAVAGRNSTEMSSAVQDTKGAIPKL